MSVKSHFITSFSRIKTVLTVLFRDPVANDFARNVGIDFIFILPSFISHGISPGGLSQINIF